MFKMDFKNKIALRLQCQLHLEYAKSNFLS